MNGDRGRARVGWGETLRRIAMNVLDRFRLDGRVALVTGGARGLGLVAARALAEAGASVVVTARDGDVAAAAAASLNFETGSPTLGRALEVTRAESVDRVVARTLEAFGRIDILVNNAG